MNVYEDGENTTVLFKVLAKATPSGCFYGLYHKESLEDEDFCDSSHMVHLVLKDFDRRKLKLLAGRSHLRNPKSRRLGQLESDSSSSEPEEDDKDTTTGVVGLGANLGLGLEKYRGKPEKNFYRLKQGDVIKFGRISYRVITCHLPQRSAARSRFVNVAMA